jgi:hypothetical protein
MTEIILNPRRRRQLQQHLKHAHYASFYRRLLAVLQIGQGKPVAEVSQALGVTRQTIYHYVSVRLGGDDCEAIEVIDDLEEVVLGNGSHH